MHSRYDTVMSPIVIAHHLVWTGYGWWLPNDPRGSMSRFVASDVLKDIGDLHLGRKRVQPTRTQLLDFFAAAEARLTYPRIEFNNAEIANIAGAFGRVIASEHYTSYACAIMPDHVHILIRKHKHSAEEMITNLQRESHLDLRASGQCDMEHPVWGGRGWKVFLDHPDEIRRTIPYIQNNPVKIRRPRQQFEFVKLYDGWPLHAGHSPNSPYVKRLRAAGRL
jgi:REP element-mobilizing transposase RayT